MTAAGRQRTGRSSGVRVTSGARGRAPERRNGQAYMYGAAAPKLEPQREPQTRERKRKADRAESLRTSIRVRRNQEKALRMDLPYVILLTIASLCTLYLCVNYLHLQSSITGRMHNIEQMEARLEQMKSENDALETSINASVDLNEIYRIATEELGMVYASRGQVLLFDKTENGYVRQYEEIPEY